MPPKDILLTCNNCEIVNSFFEGCTKKYPRAAEDDEKIAPLHNAAFEALLKSINSKTIGIGSLKQNLTTVCTSSGANLTNLNAGGGKGVIKTLPLGEKLPLRKGSGLTVADNSQRGIGKLQRHSRLKYRRDETPVHVVTHVVNYENKTDEIDPLFKNKDVKPSENDYHPLFRPVSVDFLWVFKARIKQDENTGKKVINVVLAQFLREVYNDVKAGDGQSSISKLHRLNQINSGEMPKVCSRCHFVQDYKVDSDNSCNQCEYNPSIYTSSESNPYLRFGLASGNFQPVKSFELEPLDLNPSSYKSLISMLETFDQDQKSKEDDCFPIGLDGLPGVRGVAYYLKEL